MTENKSPYSPPPTASDRSRREYKVTHGAKTKWGTLTAGEVVELQPAVADLLKGIVKPINRTTPAAKQTGKPADDKSRGR